jgi:hypothetical protein
MGKFEAVKERVNYVIGWNINVQPGREKSLYET